MRNYLIILALLFSCEKEEQCADCETRFSPQPGKAHSEYFKACGSEIQDTMGIEMIRIDGVLTIIETKCKFNT